MFRKREGKEKSGSQKAIAPIFTLHCHPFPISTPHTAPMCGPQSGGQQRGKKQRSGDHSTQNTCLQRDLIHHSFWLHPLVVLQARKLCVPWQARHRSQGLQCPLSVRPCSTQAPDKGLGGLDSPEPGLRLLPDLSQAHIHPSPLFSRASQHCLCPCFPHLQVLGVAVSPTCHQQPLTIRELENSGPAQVATAGWTLKLLHCLDRVHTSCPGLSTWTALNVLGAPALWPVRQTRDRHLEPLISPSYSFCQAHKWIAQNGQEEIKPRVLMLLTENIKIKQIYPLCT